MTTSEPSDDSDSIEITPRPAIELAGRASALATLARRGMLEADSGSDPYERETDRFDMFSWARTELIDWLTADELRVLRVPSGELAEDDFALCQAALIGASTIGWSLSLVNSDRLPVPADGSAERSVLEWSPAPWDSLRTSVGRAAIRPEADLATERERWELWYWRATDAVDASDELHEVVSEVRRSGLIPIVAYDFGTSSALPFGELSGDSRDEIEFEAGQRLHALNWICGFGDTWNDVPLYPD